MKKIAAILLSALLLMALPVYAVSRTEHGGRDVAIHEVDIIGLRCPLAGETPLDAYTLSIPEGQHCFIVYMYWHDSTLDQDMFDEETPFDASHEYAIGCIVGVDSGYYIADDCVFRMNGNAELVDPEMTFPHYYLTGAWIVQSVAMPCASNELIPGDVDQNGHVEAADALLALRHALGIIELTPEQLEFADVNGGGCTAEDALIILRYAMGIIME